MKNTLSKRWRYPDQVNVFCMLSALLLSFSGCSVEEEEDHHLEHIIPAHKPANYGDGVDQLSQRGKHFFANELGSEEVAELQDIVNWLPELAADSDLKRPQWEQVQAIAKQLKSQMDAASDSGGEKQWNQHVASLTDLVPASNDIHNAFSIKQNPSELPAEESNND
ncbi:hypothetical protein [Thalassoglobus polymorphus]|uniref:Uncharacterized protein n=1 Tax=Thalassoglobus polymorphus TaxID=2527994 RepID=A0A517QUT0_9PLAN|nr:hypothetical protein [Thalassoglobus polymorphus]QDT35388.1 hypothetical protein Mal48_46650 [Thalassoglobus polymorphus]